MAPLGTLRTILLGVVYCTKYTMYHECRCRTGNWCKARENAEIEPIWIIYDMIRSIRLACGYRAVIFFDELYRSNLLKVSKMLVNVDSQRLARNVISQSCVKHRMVYLSTGARSTILPLNWCGLGYARKRSSPPPSSIKHWQVQYLQRLWVREMVHLKLTYASRWVTIVL